MQIKKLEKNKRPHLSDEVKVIIAGNTTEVIYVSSLSHKAPITRLGGNTYALTSEVEQYGLDVWDLLLGKHPEFVYDFVSHAETRADNVAYARSSIRTLRGLINANVTDVSEWRWTTLTYAENMTDTSRLYQDFGLFIKRLRYDLGNFEYIAVCEPQGRGAWHIHNLMKFDGVAPFIPNCVPSKPIDGVFDKSKSWNDNYKALIADSRCDAPLFKAWRNGWVRVNQLRNVDNVGAYLSAYLTDMEFKSFNTLGSDEIEKAIVGGAKGFEKDVNGKSKRFVKGARLFLYPAKFNIFRTSRGIKRPTEDYMLEGDAEKIVDEDNLTGESTVQLEFDFLTEDKQYKTGIRTINRRYYNSLRSRSVDAESG